VLFERGTVRALAELAGKAPTEARPILLSESADQPPLFMLSGIHVYRRLAQHMSGACSAYGVFLEHEARLAVSPARSVEEQARDYVDIIRRAQPVGPYRLLGYSFAGMLAYEVAQQLEAAGEDVRFLALVDAHLPEWASGFRFRLAQLGRMKSLSARELLALVARKVRDPGRPLAGPLDDDGLESLERLRDAINHKAAVEYYAHIRPFAGTMTLIASAERLRRKPLLSPTCGWASFVPSIQVRQIDADHLNLMTDERFVSQMAEVLIESIQRSERSLEAARSRGEPQRWLASNV
jgi:thioesterase domain-containing protein